MTINLTDSANHPANGPLTAERIERVRDELQRSIQYQNGGDMAYVIADAIKGLEELLVSKVAASEPVPDEELDKMIWKLERDGMTPKLLSLMRELREARKAKGEPVMYCSAETIAAAKDGELLLRTLSSPSGDCVIPLYIAPPAPVVPSFDEWLKSSGQQPLGWVKEAMHEAYDSLTNAAKPDFGTNKPE